MHFRYFVQSVKKYIFRNKNTQMSMEHFLVAHLQIFLFKFFQNFKICAVMIQNISQEFLVLKLLEKEGQNILKKSILILNSV